jgi:hypothetical protein
MIWTVRTTHSAGPAGFHTSQPDLVVSYMVPYKTRFSAQLFFDREDDKAVFLFLAIH